MIRRIWPALVLGAIVIAAAGVWMYRSSTAAASAEEKELLPVQQVDFPLIVSAPGVVEAGQSVSVGPPRLVRSREHRFKLARMVEEGTQVSEGDFLMEFDGSDFHRRLREETASYQKVQEEYQKKRSDLDIQMRQLRLELEQAKSDHEKLENMLSRQADLESAIKIAETQIKRDTAKAKVQLLETKIKHVTESGRLDLEISRSNQKHYKNHMDQLLDAIDALTVSSPVSGVVIYKRDWSNEPRQVGSYVFIMDKVLEIPDLSTLRAKVLVDEIDVGKIRIGQESQIQIDAVKGRVFNGKVSQLSPILKQAAYDRPQKVAEALIEFSGPDMNLVRPWMSTRAQIKVGQHSKALVIPLSSIQERDGRSFVQVWQPANRAYEWREIQLVTNDGISAVVGSGLQANEKIRSKPKV